MPPPISTAIIAGGGLAGIAAAIRLAELGVRVTLIETRKKLGGRATSFVDARSGEMLDNCQHVVLGCCTNYLDLLDRLDARHLLTWTREQYWLEAGGRESIIRPGPLPAPLHFSGSMLRAAFLSKAEIAAVGRACLAMLRADRYEHEHETFGDYLRRLRQPERTIRRFWSPVVVSACNLDVDRVSAASALHVFQEGFLATAHAADIGLASVPLVQLYDRAYDLLESAPNAGGGDVSEGGRRGAAVGRVFLGESVESLDAASITLADGRRFTADRVICAVPVERVNKMVSAAMRDADPRFSPLDGFTHSPILGVHLAFDRPVLARPHAVLVDRPTQWLFRKDAMGQRIHAVISAADDWLDLSEPQIADRVLADIRACIPRAADARLVSARAVKEKRATFAPLPGLEALRPCTVGPSGIILAGDYTRTGWPATMEGAVRSGYSAAAAALGLDPGAFVVPSLRPSRLTAALSG